MGSAIQASQDELVEEFELFDNWLDRLRIPH